MFVKCYTNLVTFYKNIVTSQIKNGHRILKPKHGISIDDIFTIITNIHFLF